MNLRLPEPSPQLVLCQWKSPENHLQKEKWGRKTEVCQGPLPTLYSQIRQSHSLIAHANDTQINTQTHRKLQNNLLDFSSEMCSQGRCFNKEGLWELMNYVQINKHQMRRFTRGDE